jgi:hypothetical protein
MQVVIKDIRFEFDPQSIFANVTIGNRAYSVSALMTSEDLERIGKIFLGQAELLRGTE